MVLLGKEALDLHSPVLDLRAPALDLLSGAALTTSCGPRRHLPLSPFATVSPSATSTTTPPPAPRPSSSRPTTLGAGLRLPPAAHPLRRPRTVLRRRRRGWPRRGVPHLLLHPMQFYPSLNRSKCCDKGICTDELSRTTPGACWNCRWGR